MGRLAPSISANGAAPNTIATTGTRPACARAVSGRTAAPQSPKAKSRRLIGSSHPQDQHSPIHRIDKVATSSYLAAMITVGIKALKNDLSQHIRAAAAGEVVRVTDRGVVVAEIVAPRPAPAKMSEDEFIADLVRRGLATAASGRLNGPPPNNPVMTLAELMADLDEDRADR